MSETPVKITFHDAQRSEAVEAEVRRRAQKLTQYVEKVTSLQVTVDKVGKHKYQGQLYEVRIDLTVPGAEIAVSRSPADEDVYKAIGSAFEAASRKLQDLKTASSPKHHVVPAME